MLSESQTQKTIHCMILSSKTGKASLLEQCLLEGRGQGDRVARDMRKLFGVMGCSVPYRIRGWFSREAAVLGERTVLPCAGPAARGDGQGHSFFHMSCALEVPWWGRPGNQPS